MLEKVVVKILEEQHNMQRGVLCAALIATMATPLRPQPPRGNRLARTQARAQSPLTEARAGPADALELERRFRACDDPSLAPVVHGALDVLDGALRVFGPSRVFASFNGGKDAVVILHLLRAALARHHAECNTTRVAPRVVYFEHPDEFEEVRDFVHETARALDLELHAYECGLTEGLRQCVATENGAALGFVLGTRSGDPNSVGQEAFAPSSSWMPPFMRVNPILHWSYAQVWDFLRAFELPYCALYDEGYTSLGRKANTQRNPALRRSDGTYSPAWALDDAQLERAGRE